MFAHTIHTLRSAAVATGVAITATAAVLTGAAPASASPAYPCAGGQFCGFDLANGQGDMVVGRGSTCAFYDIGSAGYGDRVSSYRNRTGSTVNLYNWTGQRWQLLVSVPNDRQGNMPASVDNQTDAVEICA
ncbi:peptidase inhibitor family I36 protein [Nocardia sp. NPDC057668]|uniref:peptidase inhibitor family I36 protein n=1 Tax=Nocardia sp. NPDC057668 TaxID=3346202 RepID=UPI00366CE2DB